MSVAIESIAPRASRGCAISIVIVCGSGRARAPSTRRCTTTWKAQPSRQSWRTSSSADPRPECTHAAAASTTVRLSWKFAHERTIGIAPDIPRDDQAEARRGMSLGAECEGGGYLVGMEFPIPEDVNVRYRGGREFVGCNRIFCPTCQSWVRHVHCRQLGERPTTRAAHEWLYENLADGGRADRLVGPGDWQRRIARLRVQMQHRRLREPAAHLVARERLALRRASGGLRSYVAVHRPRTAGWNQSEVRGYLPGRCAGALGQAGVVMTDD